MKKKKLITITIENMSLQALLDDSPTAEKIYAALPIDGRANTWGKEIYFEIPVTLEPEPNARVEVDVGTLGYWPAGRAFCIFLGPTPVSTGDKPCAASPVNVFGSVIGDVKQPGVVKNGASIKIEISKY